MHRLVCNLILISILLGACSAPGSNSAAPDPVILTSTSLLADLARQVAGDRVQIKFLLPIGADPHSYQPTPQDVAAIERSRLFIINGLEYEHALEPLLENAIGETNVVEAAAGLHPREDASGERGVDPHAWLDPNLVVVYIENIREALTHFDPEGASIYQTNADAYTAQLKELNAWIEGEVSNIPPEHKLLVTNHEALGYFAERYGFTIVGAVVESFSSEASPSAQQMAALIDQIKISGAPAIFVDAGDNPALAQQVAEEANVRVVDDLRLESLTDGAPAATYIDMMKYNVTRIAGALK